MEEACHAILRQQKVLGPLASLKFNTEVVVCFLFILFNLIPNKNTSTFVTNLVNIYQVYDKMSSYRNMIRKKISSAIIFIWRIHKFKNQRGQKVITLIGLESNLIGTWEMDLKSLYFLSINVTNYKQHKQSRGNFWNTFLYRTKAGQLLYFISAWIKQL